MVKQIYNGIDEETFVNIDKQEARERLGLPTDKIILLFVAMGGMRSKLKGGDLMSRTVEALANNNILFVNIGSTPEEEWEHLIHLPRVNDRKKLALYYSCADVFIFPSLAENCPLVVLESLACGTPVVAFQVGGLPEIADHKKNGYLAKYEDLEDFLKGIRYFIKDNEGRRAAGRYGRQTVLERFTRKRMIKEYQMLFEDTYNRFHQGRANNLSPAKRMDSVGFQDVEAGEGLGNKIMPITEKALLSAFETELQRGDRSESVEFLEKKLKEKEQVVARQSEQLIRQSEQLNQRHRQMNQRDRLLNEKEQIIKQKSELQEQYAEKYNRQSEQLKLSQLELEKSSRLVQEKEKIIAQLEKRGENQKEQLTRQEEQLKQRNLQLEQKDQQVKKNEAVGEGQKEQLIRHMEQLKLTREQLEKKGTLLKEKEKIINNQSERLIRQEEQLKQRYVQLERKNNQLKQKDDQIESYKQQLSELQEFLIQERKQGQEKEEQLKKIYHSRFYKILRKVGRSD